MTGGSGGRAAHGLRDMALSVLVLTVMAVGLVFITKGCTFSPGRPEVDGAPPSVDLSVQLGGAAATVDFPVRLPATPAGWRANSSSTSAVGSGGGASVVVRAGWLTADGRFVQLSQSGGALSDVLAVETDRTGAGATGSFDVAGVAWTVYPARRDEVAWTATVGGVTVLITGNGTHDEFETLATAVVAATPLPTHR